ncbi:hypothetical protein A3718_17645, partial [Erythrobacter sp. HI0019]|uniref:hypothetical protein n=1 Tax=Erythrobacter sp. HI0019 TaxID=1822222 RepID=UPI0007B86E98
GLSAGGETLGFSTPRAEVDALAEQAFGAAPAKSRNEECGAGPMDFSQFGPLQIAYLDGSFAGWFLRAGEGVVTADGIAPGVTTLDALQDERQVQQLDTTLEGEFQYTTGDYGTITGFAAPDGSIDARQAGFSCFFRLTSSSHAPGYYSTCRPPSADAAFAGATDMYKSLHDPDR